MNGLKDVVMCSEEVLCGLKRKETLTHATPWMDREDTRRTETSQTRKDRHSCGSRALEDSDSQTRAVERWGLGARGLV